MEKDKKIDAFEIPRGPTESGGKGGPIGELPSEADALTIEKGPTESGVKGP